MVKVFNNQKGTKHQWHAIYDIIFFQPKVKKKKSKMDYSIRATVTYNGWLNSDPCRPLPNWDILPNE